MSRDARVGKPSLSSSEYRIDRRRRRVNVVVLAFAVSGTLAVG
jgi:hypothetical protein